MKLCEENDTLVIVVEIEAVEEGLFFLAVEEVEEVIGVGFEGIRT